MPRAPHRVKNRPAGDMAACGSLRPSGCRGAAFVRLRFGCLLASEARNAKIGKTLGFGPAASDLRSIQAARDRGSGEARITLCEHMEHLAVEARRDDSKRGLETHAPRILPTHQLFYARAAKR